MMKIRRKKSQLIDTHIVWQTSKAHIEMYQEKIREKTISIANQEKLIKILYI